MDQQPFSSTIADHSQSFDLELLTAQEVAALLKVSDKTVYKLWQAGELQSIRWRGTVRMRRQDLLAFINQNLT